jgi:hypothetical protein
MVFAVGIAVSMACASTPEPAPEAPAAPETPAWIESPSIEGGFVATECVKNIEGQRSILKKKASMLARAEIANQIDVRVQELAKQYRELVELAEGNAISENFDQTVKTLTNEQLLGSRVTRTGYQDFGEGVQYLCVMVELDPAHTDTFYKALVGDTGMGDRLSPQQDAVLFQQFKASQAQAELKEETGG